MYGFKKKNKQKTKPKMQADFSVCIEKTSENQLMGTYKL